MYLVTRLLLPRLYAVPIAQISCLANALVRVRYVPRHLVKSKHELSTRAGSLTALAIAWTRKKEVIVISFIMS